MFELNTRKELEIFKAATPEGQLLLYEGVLERVNQLMHRWHKKIGYREINNKKKSLEGQSDGEQKPKRGVRKLKINKN